MLWNPVEVLLSHMSRASLSVPLLGVMAHTAELDEPAERRCGSATSQS